MSATQDAFASECEAILEHVHYFENGKPRSMVIPNGNMPAVVRALRIASRCTVENISKAIRDAEVEMPPMINKIICDAIHAFLTDQPEEKK